MRVRIVLVAALVIGLAVGVGRVQAQAVAWQGFAHAWIAAHAQRVKGQAPRETRKHCEGDVNGDGHGDVVVIYAIEGAGGADANAWTQYVTVLTSTQQGYGATLPKEVGGKGVRAVDGCTIAGTSVALAIKTYAPKDAACCPSVPGTAGFAFEKGVLVEAPAPTASGT